MPIRTAEAEWKGDLRGGGGRLKLGSGLFEGPYSFRSRFEDGRDTNPEELIGAAHAACFSMALSLILGNAGHVPTRIRTLARVHIEKAGEGFAITRIELDTEGQVPGIDAAAFRESAEQAKAGCPVSKALAATPISLTARLV
ncbi:MAG TPA: OsmC family protein [Gemmatimonadota bacterium]|jgi:osmotically inducible protein OsmC